MRNAKYTVKPTTQFKKDYKLVMKRGLDIGLLESVIADIAMGTPLSEKNKDHALSGNWVAQRSVRKMIFTRRRMGVFPCTAFFLM